MKAVKAETSNYPVAQANGFIAPIDNTVPSDAIWISTPAELAAIDGSKSAGKYYVLANDIYLTSEWTPIENFSGTLDGQGHSINNLYVLSSSNRQNAGLFATASASAVIKNVGVILSVLGISSGSAYDMVNVGGLIGDSSGAAIISCYITGSILGTTNVLITRIARPRTGGLVGNSSGGRITDSYASGSVNASVSTGNQARDEGPTAGGLIGRGIGLTIINSYSISDISVSILGENAWIDSIGGGISGVFSGAITNSYATGAVTSTHNGVFGSACSGGLIGQTVDGITVITDSYAAGTLFSKGPQFGKAETGGLIAARTSGANVTITNSYHLDDVVTFTITVTASPVNGGTVTGGGTFMEGTDVTLQATPNAGWTFDGWFDGNNRVSPNSTWNFSVIENRTLEARFINVPFANPHSAWARDELTNAFNAGLIPPSLIGSNIDFRTSTTRAEYCALAVTLYENIMGAITGRTTFADTNDINVQKMAYIGVVQGVGENRFDPKAPLTREQAATMLSRLANALGQPLPAQSAAFADNGKISSWAYEGVGQVQAAGIMTGVGDNRFAPSDPYTREQSIITMIRLFNVVS